MVRTSSKTCSEKSSLGFHLKCLTLPRPQFIKLFSFPLSISPTLHEQLLRQNPFDKKITKPNCKQIKAAQKKLSYEKAALKILVKLTPGH